MDVVKNEDNHLALAAGRGDTGTGDWVRASWVKDLFNNEPLVVGLGEFLSEGGGFHYDFAVAVKLPDGSLRYYLLEWISFNYDIITHLVRTLFTSIEEGEAIWSRWLESPLRRTTCVIVNRQTLGLVEPKPEPKTVAADREEQIAADHELRTAKGDEEMKKGNCCTECGVSFATNAWFGSGDEKLCGECEAKHDEASGNRQVHLEFVFQRRRLLVPKRNTSFDPRPGIDDVGLGGSGSNWED